METKPIPSKEEASLQLKQLLQMGASFTSAKCAKCERKANVVAGKIWECTCGEINSVPTNKPIYENPEIGPSKEEIQLAISSTNEG